MNSFLVTVCEELCNVTPIVDRVRKMEHRELLSIGDKTLSISKYDWLRNASKLDGRSRKHFTALTKLNLKTARAWAIKETAGRLWDYTQIDSHEFLKPLKVFK